MNDSIATAERVARAVAPEMAGVPLYILQPEDGGIVTPAMLDGCGGFYQRGLDQHARAYLEAAGQWRGPGLAIVLDVAALLGPTGRIPSSSDGAGQLSTVDSSNGDGLRRVVGAVLHEILHWVCSSDTTPDGVTEAARAATALERRCDPPAETSRLPRAIWQHGQDFTRLACHVWWRATHGGGITMRPDYLAFGAAYPTLEALSRPVAYVDALGDELAALRDLPLRAVAKIDPPETFVALWQQDERRLWDLALEAA